MPIMTARCWQLKRRCEMWMVRMDSYPKGAFLWCMWKKQGNVRKINMTSYCKTTGSRNLIWSAEEKIQSLAMRYKEEKLFGNWVLIKGSLKSGLTCFPNHVYQLCIWLLPGMPQNPGLDATTAQDFTLR